MNNLFLPYDLSLSLKEIGFDEECFGIYFMDGTIAYDGEKYVLPTKNDKHPGTIWFIAPLYDQVIQWFVEKYGLHIVEYPIKVSVSDKEGYRWRYAVDDINNWESTYHDESPLGFLKIHEALNAGIKKAIELIKQKS